MTAHISPSDGLRPPGSSRVSTGFFTTRNSAGASTVLLFMLLALILLGSFLSGNQASATEVGNPYRQVIYVTAFFLTLLITKSYTQPRKLLAIPWLIVLALVWCWISMTWTAIPSIASRRLILTTMIILTMFVVITEAGYTHSTRAIKLALALTLLLNYLAMPVYPLAVHHQNEFGDPGLIGDWRGVLPHKNFTGSVCAVTIIYFAFAAEKTNKYLRLAIMVGAAFFLYKTGSKTSMGLVVPALAAGWLMRYYDSRYRGLVIPLVLILLAVAGFAFQFLLSDIHDFMADPTGLTGRTQIWPLLLKYASDHLFTGAGYGSFWGIGVLTPMNDYTSTWVAGVGNGHNGYLDLLVTVGLPGLIIILFAVVFVPFGKLLMSRTILPERMALLSASLFFCVCHNMTESSLFDRDAIMNAVLILTVALINCATKRDPVRAAATVTTARPRLKGRPTVLRGGPTLQGQIRRRAPQ